jgi:hypothetical protein
MAQAGLRRRATLAALALAALGGCAGGAVRPSAPVGALPTLQVFPGSLLLPAPGPPRPHLPDTCGAAALAGLVGKPRTQIPVPVDLTRRRVACTACPVAPDVRLDRLNILYDAQSGLVTKITCG